MKSMAKVVPLYENALPNMDSGTAKMGMRLTSKKLIELPSIAKDSVQLRGAKETVVEIIDTNVDGKEQQEQHRTES